MFPIRRFIASFVCLTFIVSTCPPVFAQEFSVRDLPVPGTMVSVSPAFEPALIRGLTVHKDNPFLFDFIVDPGQSKYPKEVLKDESLRMIKYFFAALTIPDKDIWVNLSPYEKDRMVPVSLGQTAMGRDLLAQDYLLKQLTASLIYPQKTLGKTFWDTVYTKAKAMYGTTQIPVNTFNKVWIVPQRVGIYEHGQTAFIVDGHLKVMLEEDYLSLTKHNANYSLPLVGRVREGGDVNALGSQIIRQIILPEIEKEINEGKNFATLRQIFYAQALAVWFKRNLKQALLNRVYANKGTVKGIDQNDAATNEAIYHQYLRAYKKGVFNYIKEDIDPVTQETLPRKYFSGGYFGNAAKLAFEPRNLSQVPMDEVNRAQIATVAVVSNGRDAAVLAEKADREMAKPQAPDAAMLTDEHILNLFGKFYADDKNLEIAAALTTAAINGRKSEEDVLNIYKLLQEKVDLRSSRSIVNKVAAKLTIAVVSGNKSVEDVSNIYKQLYDKFFKMLPLSSIESMEIVAAELTIAAVIGNQDVAHILELFHKFSGGESLEVEAALTTTAAINRNKSEEEVFNKYKLLLEKVDLSSSRSLIDIAAAKLTIAVVNGNKSVEDVSKLYEQFNDKIYEILPQGILLTFEFERSLVKTVAELTNLASNAAQYVEGSQVSLEPPDIKEGYTPVQFADIVSQTKGKKYKIYLTGSGVRSFSRYRFNLKMDEGRGRYYIVGESLGKERQVERPPFYFKFSPEEVGHNTRFSLEALQNLEIHPEEIFKIVTIKNATMTAKEIARNFVGTYVINGNFVAKNDRQVEIPGSEPFPNQGERQLIEGQIRVNVLRDLSTSVRSKYPNQAEDILKEIRIKVIYRGLEAGSALFAVQLSVDTAMLIPFTKAWYEEKERRREQAKQEAIRKRNEEVHNDWVVARIHSIGGGHDDFTRIYYYNSHEDVIATEDSPIYSDNAYQDFSLRYKVGDTVDHAMSTPKENPDKYIGEKVVLSPEGQVYSGVPEWVLDGYQITTEDTGEYVDDNDHHRGTYGIIINLKKKNAAMTARGKVAVGFVTGVLVGWGLGAWGPEIKSRIEQITSNYSLSVPGPEEINSVEVGSEGDLIKIGDYFIGSQSRQRWDVESITRSSSGYMVNLTSDVGKDVLYVSNDLKFSKVLEIANFIHVAVETGETYDEIESIKSPHARVYLNDIVQIGWHTYRVEQIRANSNGTFDVYVINTAIGQNDSRLFPGILGPDEVFAWGLSTPINPSWEGYIENNPNVVSTLGKVEIKHIPFNTAHGPIYAFVQPNGKMVAMQSNNGDFIGEGDWVIISTSQGEYKFKVSFFEYKDAKTEPVVIFYNHDHERRMTMREFLQLARLTGNPRGQYDEFTGAVKAARSSDEAMNVKPVNLSTDQFRPTQDRDAKTVEDLLSSMNQEFLDFDRYPEFHNIRDDFLITVASYLQNERIPTFESLRGLDLREYTAEALIRCMIQRGELPAIEGADTSTLKAFQISTYLQSKELVPREINAYDGLVGIARNKSSRVVLANLNILHSEAFIAAVERNVTRLKKGVRVVEVYAKLNRQGQISKLFDRDEKPDTGRDIVMTVKIDLDNSLKVKDMRVAFPPIDSMESFSLTNLIGDQVKILREMVVGRGSVINGVGLPDEAMNVNYAGNMYPIMSVIKVMNGILDRWSALDPDLITYSRENREETLFELVFRTAVQSDPEITPQMLDDIMSDVTIRIPNQNSLLFRSSFEVTDRYQMKVSFGERHRTELLYREFQTNVLPTIRNEIQNLKRKYVLYMPIGYEVPLSTIQSMETHILNQISGDVWTLGGAEPREQRVGLTMFDWFDLSSDRVDHKHTKIYAAQVDDVIVNLGRDQNIAERILREAKTRFISEPAALRDQKRGALEAIKKAAQNATMTSEVLISKVKAVGVVMRDRDRLGFSRDVIPMADTVRTGLNAENQPILQLSAAKVIFDNYSNISEDDRSKAKKIVEDNLEYVPDVERLMASDIVLGQPSKFKDKLLRIAKGNVLARVKSTIDFNLSIRFLAIGIALRHQASLGLLNAGHLSDIKYDVSRFLSPVTVPEERFLAAQIILNKPSDFLYDDQTRAIVIVEEHLQNDRYRTQLAAAETVLRNSSVFNLGVREAAIKVVNDVLDTAMISPRHETFSQGSTKVSTGGIDLSQQDAALHVEKDANGGVKVNVDPALIARIEREGMPEVVPVIINMQPADMRSLFGVEVKI